MRHLNSWISHRPRNREQAVVAIGVEFTSNDAAPFTLFPNVDPEIVETEVARQAAELESVSPDEQRRFTAASGFFFSREDREAILRLDGEAGKQFVDSIGGLEGNRS